MNLSLILALCFGIVAWSMLGGFGGFIIGAGLGWLFGVVLDLRARLEQLTRQLHEAGVIARPAPQRQGRAPGNAVPGQAHAHAPPEHAPQTSAAPTPVGPPITVAPIAVPAAMAAHTARSEVAMEVPAIKRPAMPMSDDATAGERAPDLVGAWLSRFKNWLTSGNLPVKVGVVVLLFGAAAAIKYATHEGWLSVPMWLRLAGIAGMAVAGLAYGIRSSAARPAFGVAVQGGALGVLLLVVFGAFTRYQLISPGVAFACVVGIGMLAATLALRFNAPALAVLGLLGGFLAPALIFTESSNPVALFAYVALLDVAVLALAWRRPWRMLNLLAFAGTFLLGLGWGWRYYTPEFFYQVEPFLALFFAFFAIIPVLYARTQVARGENDKQVDATLLFGTPLVAFPMQAALLGDDPAGLGLSALVVAGVYGAIALFARRRGDMVHILQGAGALSIGFLALAAPLALSGRWTSAAWALQGLAMVFMGLRQNRNLMRGAGLVLIVMGSVAGATGLLDGGWFKQADRFLFNAFTLDVGVLVVAPLLAAWLHHRAQRTAEAGALLALSLGWWAAWGFREITLNLRVALDMGSTRGFVASAYALFTALTAGMCSLARRRVDWLALSAVQVIASVVVLTLGVIALLAGGHWFAAPLWLFWPAVAILLVTLSTISKEKDQGLVVAHLCLAALAILGVGLSLARVAALAGLGDGWQMALGAMAPGAFLYLLAKRREIALWPVSYPDREYSWFMGIASWSLIGMWMVAQAQPGSAAPLPFVPVFNPLELGIVAGLVLAWRYRNTLKPIDQMGVDIGLALVGWMALSMATLRAVHHIDGAPWSVWILGNPAAQVSLTVVWCVAGVVAWVAGSRRGSRTLWRMGAILLSLVLAKLALIDRIWLGNMEGIIAFLVVGVLLVLVGRFAPSPPKDEKIAQET